MAFGILDLRHTTSWHLATWCGDVQLDDLPRCLAEEKNLLTLRIPRLEGPKGPKMEGVSEFNLYEKTQWVFCGGPQKKRRHSLRWSHRILEGRVDQIDVWGSTFIREWPTNPNPLPREAGVPCVSRCTNATTHNAKQFEKVVQPLNISTWLVFQVVFFPYIFSERFVWKLPHLWAPNQPPPPPPSSSSSSSPPQLRIQGDIWWQCFPWSLGGNVANHRIFVSSSFAPRYDHLEQRNEFLPLAVGTEDVPRDVGSGSGSGCEAWP